MGSFKELYNKAKTHRDIDCAIETLSIEEKLKLLDALETTRDYISITMRDESLLSTLKRQLDFM